MAFSKRQLFKEIHKQVSFKTENYIHTALELIDLAMENEEVTDSFYNEYFKLKRNLELIYPNLININIGIITSIIVSLALEASLLVFLILIPIAFIVSLWILFNYATKQGTVLEPYLLKKMEEKISSRPVNSAVIKRSTSSGKKSMKSNNYISPIWDKLNISLTIVTVITTVIFLAFFALSFIYRGNDPSNGFVLGMCGVFASLASAFFIAVFMRIFEIHKQRQRQSHALKLLQPLFLEIFTTINQFYPQIKAFVSIGADDTLRYSHERVFYTNPDLPSGNKSFIDFDVEFKKAKFDLDQDLAKCLSSPLLLQCHDNVIDLLTNLKLNGFTLNLLETQKVTPEEMSQTAFMGIYKNFSAFEDYYLMLSELSGSRPTQTLWLLDDAEKDLYIKEIDAILPQLPAHNGSIYKGNVRIK